MRISKIGQILFLLLATSLFTLSLTLAGCGGGTSGSTPDISNPSFVGKRLVIRAQIFDRSGNYMIGKPMELSNSSQVEETNESGIATFSLVMESKDEIVLTVAGQNMTVNPETIPAMASLVGIAAQLGEDAPISVEQREIQVEPDGECASLMNRVDGMDFNVAAKDLADSDSLVPCSISMRQTAKGEPDRLVLGWSVGVNCHADGVGEELANVVTDQEGLARIEFDLDLSKRGCHYTVYPQLDGLNPDSDHAGIGLKTHIRIR